MYVLYRISKGLVPLTAKLERFERLTGSHMRVPILDATGRGFVIDPDDDEMSSAAPERKI